jgi:hypothetical protein
MGYFAWVLDLSEVRESPDTAVVLMFKGPCEVETRRSGWSIGCRGRGLGKEVAASKFRMDPILDSASISVKHRRGRHRVGWTATQPVPGLYSYSEACFGLTEEGEPEEGSGEGGGIVKGAKAAGRILGHRLKTSTRFDTAGLWGGANRHRVRAAVGAERGRPGPHPRTGQRQDPSGGRPLRAWLTNGLD